MGADEGQDVSQAEAGAGWSLALAPVLWLTQLGLIYVATPFVCRTGRVWVLHAITAVCLLIASWLLYRATRRWSALAKEKAAPDDFAQTEEIASRQFAAIVGVMVNTFFLSLIFASGIPPLLVDPCGR